MINSIHFPVKLRYLQRMLSTTNLIVLYLDVYNKLILIRRIHKCMHRLPHAATAVLFLLGEREYISNQIWFSVLQHCFALSSEDWKRRLLLHIDKEVAGPFTVINN
ncbi:hypothetical protein GDO86_011177 [Hymenochirus boettgeri]|uniref:Uncharacterized protein n=1 Tax=Hymenochirus boettgeri TaxID=247094 RepID=A0A8T2JFC5_9PIPI|nr:hypothetical protein GDO86_011177 [Hymenochirus boettgeri]